MSGSPDSPSGSQTGSHWLELSMQPAFRLVALMEESISYDRRWVFPFHHFSLCVRDDPDDPSWVEVEETGERVVSVPGTATLILANTPVRIRYTTKNLHTDIHFRYEMFPGIDVFSKLRGCFRIPDPQNGLPAKAAAPSPPAAGPARASIPRLALGDCASSSRALAGLPGDVRNTLRVPRIRQGRRGRRCRGPRQNENCWWYLNGAYGARRENEAAILATLGRSVVGRDAENILIRAAAESRANGGAPVPLHAKGWACIAAAHAYAAEPQLFSEVRFTGPPPSWTDLVVEQTPGRESYATAVWGALMEYDWPDLVMDAP